MAKKARQSHGKRGRGRPPLAGRTAEQFSQEVNQLLVRVNALKKIRDAMELHKVKSIEVSVDMENTFMELKRLIDEGVSSINLQLPKLARLDPVGVYFINGDTT